MADKPDDTHRLTRSAAFGEIAYLLPRGHPPPRGEPAGYAGESDAGRAPGSLVTDRR
jgi:hypothetical protein